MTSVADISRDDEAMALRLNLRSFSRGHPSGIFLFFRHMAVTAVHPTDTMDRVGKLGLFIVMAGRAQFFRTAGAQALSMGLMTVEALDLL